MFALNLNTTATSSEIYFETNDDRCNDNSYDGYNNNRYGRPQYSPPPRYEPPPTQDERDYSEYSRYYRNSTEEIDYEDDENNSTVVLPVSTLPHLSDFIGWSIQGSAEVTHCNKYKIWDTEFDNGRGTTRIYKDFLLYIFGAPWSVIEREKETGQIFEENIVVKNDGYQIKKTFYAGGRDSYSISANVKKDNTKTSIQVSSKRYRGYPFDIRGNGSLYEDPIVSFDMEINESQTEKYKAKLVKGDDKIFDAWFYDVLGMNGNIKDLVNIRIPSYLNQKSFTLTNFILADITEKFERLSEIVRQNY